MKIESVLIRVRTAEFNDSPACSGILFDGNLAVTTGAILMPFLRGSTFEKDEILSKLKFSVCTESKGRVNGENRLIFREAKMADIWKCPLVSRSVENLLSDWTVKNGRSEDVSVDGKTKESISILAFLECENGKSIRRRVEEEVSTLFSSGDIFGEPERGEQVQVFSTPFGNEIFFNSFIRGIVSNLAGIENCLILTDAKMVPGCEGGPIFAAKKSRNQKEDDKKLVGMITSPLVWWRGEWIGLSIGISLMPVLRRFLQGKIKSFHFVDTFINPTAADSGINTEVIDEVVVFVQCGIAWGSGIVFDSRTVITCSHLLKQGEKVYVFFKKIHYSASVIYKTRDDVAYDLAVIKLKDDVFKKRIEFCEESPEIGDEIIAAGFPFFSEKDDFDLLPTLVRGNIARMNAHMIQTTCCIQSGFSGGALLKSGKLIGIFIYNVKNNATGALYPHVNFAVPSSVFKDLLFNYVKTNNVKYLELLESSDPEVQFLWSLTSSKL